MTSVNPKLLQILDDFLSGRSDPVTSIIEGEKKRGFDIIRPGDAPWFRAVNWRAESVASIKGKRVRLVLLHAFEEGQGSLTLTLKAIVAAGLKPAIIDPTRELAATLTRRGWKMHVEGSSFDDREDVWTPTKHAAK